MVASNPNEDAILDKNLTQDKCINDISEPNALFKYASVNYISTFMSYPSSRISNASQFSGIINMCCYFLGLACFAPH